MTGRRATGRFGPGPVSGPAKTGATRSEGGVGAMTRLSLFNSPLLLGFDHIEEMLERLSKAPGDSYPPYNIEQTGPDGLRITLAVAGFAPSDLAVTVENNQLVIRGKQAERSPAPATAAAPAWPAAGCRDRRPCAGAAAAGRAR